MQSFLRHMRSISPSIYPAPGAMVVWQNAWNKIACKLLAASLMLTGSPGVAIAAPPNTVYFVTRQDAVTGDNTPRVFTHPKASYSAGAACYLPDANGTVVIDSFTQDVYERPTSSGSGATQFYDALDIVSGQTKPAPVKTLDAQR